MIAIGLIIGTLSYIIFFLGILNFINYKFIGFVGVLFILFIFLYIILLLVNHKKKIDFYKIPKSFIVVFVLLLLASQVLINLIGALGPELGFDALWYHLTIPKIFIDQGKIVFIPGQLFYYSVMPKNIDLLFIPGLIFFDEISAKLIHFSFGLLSLLMLYKISRYFLNKKYSLISTLIFYSNLVVGWQSITAYIDLGKAFYELCLLYLLIGYLKTKKIDLLVVGVVIGLAIGSKNVSVITLVPMTGLLFYINHINKLNLRKNIVSMLNVALYSLVTLFPWVLFSFITTENPVYPIFESEFKLSAFDQGIFIYIVNGLYKFFLFLDDPINPVYFIFLPLFVIFYKKFKKDERILLLISFVLFLVGILITPIGGSRFIISYLGIFSLVSSILVSKVEKLDIFVYKTILVAVLIISITSIVYRGVANYRYLPVIIGLESKSNFLTNNLNFNFGDFYDTDSYFAENHKNNLLRIDGFHNLYYVNFPYFLSEWSMNLDYNYYSVQGQNSKDNSRRIYFNNFTNVSVYRNEN